MIITSINSKLTQPKLWNKNSAPEDSIPTFIKLYGQTSSGLVYTIHQHNRSHFVRHRWCLGYSKCKILKPLHCRLGVKILLILHMGEFSDISQTAPLRNQFTLSKLKTPHFLWTKSVNINTFKLKLPKNNRRQTRDFTATVIRVNVGWNRYYRFKVALYEEIDKTKRKY